jgi:hypothetical protein
VRGPVLGRVLELILDPDRDRRVTLFEYLVQLEADVRFGVHLAQAEREPLTVDHERP